MRSFGVGLGVSFAVGDVRVALRRFSEDGEVEGEGPGGGGAGVEVAGAAK